MTHASYVPTLVRSSRQSPLTSLTIAATSSGRGGVITLPIASLKTVALPPSSAAARSLALSFSPSLRTRETPLRVGNSFSNASRTHLRACQVRVSAYVRTYQVRGTVTYDTRVQLTIVSPCSAAPHRRYSASW